MVFPILGSGIEPAAYNIDNSLRFNDDDDAYLTVTGSSTTSSGKTSTLSVWVKRSKLGAEQYILHARSADSQGNFARLEFSGSDTLRFRGYTTTYLETDAEYRDPSAWYHIVLALDTDTSGDGNSCRLYVNGSEVTSFSTDTNPSTDDDLVLGSDRAHYVGASFYGGGAGAEFDGYMADLHFIDGQQLTPSSFGKTDNDSGIWTPLKYSGTFGGNGFFLEFQQSGTGTNSSGIGADTSGNDSHLAVTNLAATDQTTDTPTNNFSTLRIAQAPQASPAVLSEGNCDFDYTQDGSETRDGTNHCVSTIAMSSGKWYCECKILESNVFVFGIENMSRRAHNDNIENWYGIYGADGTKATQDYTGQSVVYGTYGSAFSTGDIGMCALDMDNKNIYWGKGGSWGDGSGNFDEASPNTAHAISTNFLTIDGDGENVVFTFFSNSSGASPRFQVNFGNPVHSISSGNADANGYGNFEYAVPSGYYALCTKNLALYGG